MTEEKDIDKWVNEVHQGDAKKKLSEMPTGSVDLVICSPPYYGLRDYGAEGQIGLEETPYDFIQNLVDVGDEIYRVLKESGSWYLNLGDTYAGGGGVSGKPDDWEDQHKDDVYPDSVPAKDVDFPDKCKMLIPHRTAISLIDRGWICRNDNVWAKPNPMPENVSDRRCTSFEFFFHFVKNGDYYFDMDSIRKPYSENSKDRYNYEFNEDLESQETQTSPAVGAGDIDRNPNGRIPRDVMQVKTAKYPDAHFAVYPKNLIEPFIKSSCPENGIVLDPFIGSGTTAIVAEQLDRNWIGIDLSKDYVDMSYDRVEEETQVIHDDRSLFDQ